MKKLPEIKIDDAAPTPAEFDRFAFLGADAIKLYNRLKPFEDNLTEVKKMLREEALGRKVMIIIPKSGTVGVKTPPVSTKPLKSLMLNTDAFKALPISLQKKLLKAGVVRITRSTPRAATASVTINSVK